MCHDGRLGASGGAIYINDLLRTDNAIIVVYPICILQVIKKICYRNHCLGGFLRQLYELMYIKLKLIVSGYMPDPMCDYFR